jgi:hypothetical protein
MTWSFCLRFQKRPNVEIRRFLRTDAFLFQTGLQMISIEEAALPARNAANSILAAQNTCRVVPFMRIRTSRGSAFQKAADQASSLQ